mmetsp:Transcript_17706/g.43329  ORF Transcript_17706/g.43329 Transcript_17706/m.43329 type:complete len:223 (-) Transcript_17706:46-714(-)
MAAVRGDGGDGVWVVRTDHVDADTLQGAPRQPLLGPNSPPGVCVPVCADCCIFKPPWEPFLDPSDGQDVAQGPPDLQLTAYRCGRPARVHKQDPMGAWGGLLSVQRRVSAHVERPRRRLDRELPHGAPRHEHGHALVRWPHCRHRGAVRLCLPRLRPPLPKPHPGLHRGHRSVVRGGPVPPRDGGQRNGGCVKACSCCGGGGARVAAALLLPETVGSAMEDV